MLSVLGLEEREQKLYLALAESGKATAQLLSKRCALPRTTTYFALGRLIDRGLVVEERKKRTTFYTPQPATIFQGLVDKEEAALKERRAAADALAELLPQFFRSKLFSVPSVQFFEGKKRIEVMLDAHLPLWYESMREEDNVWWGYQDRDFVREYRAFLERYWQMKERKQRVCLLSNASDLEREIDVPNREIRPVPADAEFSSTIWICGSFIIVIVHRTNPRYAFQVKDPVLASNLKVVFRLLWERLNVTSTGDTSRSRGRRREK